MESIFTFKNKYGKLEFYENNKIIYIKSIGIVTPELIKKELAELTKYMVDKYNYTYIVDLRDLVFPHPINAIYLSKIYRLPNFDNFYIYSEKWYFSAMLKSFKFLVPYTKFLTADELKILLKS